MTERNLSDLLERAGDRTQVGTPPIDEMVTHAARARRHQRVRLAVGGCVAAVSLLAAGSTALTPFGDGPDSTPGPIAGSSAGAGEPTPDEPGAPATYVPTQSPRGLGMSADAAIAAVTAAINSPSIDHLEMTTTSGTNVREMTIFENASSTTGGNDVSLTWEASLALGAVAESMRTDEETLSQVIDRAAIVVRLPSGVTKTMDPATIGGIAAGQVFASEDDSTSDTSRIEKATTVLHDFGLTPESIQIRHPLGAAIAIRASLPDDANPGWTIDQLRQAVTGSPTEYEGVLLEITSPNGESRLVAGASFRTGLGGLWFAPDQDVRFGAQHGSIPESAE